MLWTTPEFLHERLPVSQEDGRYAITADARIDNRGELIAVLNIPPHQITDSEIILYAYRRWDERCPRYRIGDFSFAIWDKLQHKLFCARDPMGVKPFFYHHSSRLFAFASEIKGIFCLEEVFLQLNEEKLAAGGLITDLQDNSATLYENVRRLPPGWSITLDPTMRVQQYWERRGSLAARNSPARCDEAV